LRFLDHTQLGRHTYIHTYLVALKSAVAEVATYTTHNKHKGRISIPLAGFEPIVLTVERPQNYALDRSATGIGLT
jgi:hypothetical protein